MAKEEKAKVKRQLTKKELEAKEMSKQKMERDCDYMIREFNRKQEERKKRKVS
jgi:hypothetical protein